MKKRPEKKSESKGEAISQNEFRKAVESTSDIKNGYKEGLKALRTNSSRIKCHNTAKIEGSVDLDEQTKPLYPGASRWDYAVSISGEVYFLEVHPAETSEVKNVIEKKKWLESWLIEKAPLIKKMSAGKTRYWIQSGRCNILKGSKQYRMIAANNIILCKLWDYDLLKHA